MQDQPLHDDENDDMSLNLFDVIETDDYTDYCGEGYRFQLWEQNVAKPLLEAKGYRVIRVYSTEYDSFGPLGRAFVVEKDGEVVEVYYG